LSAKNIMTGLAAILAGWSSGVAFGSPQEVGGRHFDCGLCRFLAASG